MEIIGYFASLLIGLSLGLIGGGGSILTVPVLVYLFNIDAVLATGYSLFIVGLTSGFGAIKAASKKNIDLKAAAIFALPAFATVAFTRSYLLPSIPDVLFTVANFEVTKHIGILVLFALIMMAASYSMLKRRVTQSEGSAEMKAAPNYPLILINGAFVGIFTGLVGAGGGFLIIPVLVFFAKLPMKKAVGTSLLIISANSAVGFFSDQASFQNIDWPFLLSIATIAVAGIFTGLYLSKFIDGKKLKKGFGWFVLTMAVYILLKELVFN